MHSRFTTRIAQASIRALLIAAPCLLNFRPALAQGSVVIITGIVTGPNAAVIAGATVSARAADSSTRSTVTNDNGKYMLVFPKGGAAFRVTVRATGYVAWIGEVRRAYNDNRILADVTLRTGGTAADWPPAKPTSPALTYARADLGAADAVSVTVDAGDILVRGTSTDRIVYRTYTQFPTPTNADSPMPVEIAPPGIHDVNDHGLTIAAGSGVTVLIEVPRTLKHLKLTVAQHGLITVGTFDGELSILNASGTVRLGAVGGPTLVESRNGDIDASIGIIPSAMNFLGRNGNVTVSMSPDARASFAAEVHGGTITLDSTSRVVYPPSGGIDINSIEDHRVNVPPPDPSSRLPWTIGGGGAMISITSLNGNVIIRKNNPPKQE